MCHANNEKWKKTRKLSTIHKALHPRDDIDRLYVSRKERRRGLASIEDNVDTSYGDSKTLLGGTIKLSS